VEGAGINPLLENWLNVVLSYQFFSHQLSKKIKKTKSKIHKSEASKPEGIYLLLGPKDPGTQRFGVKFMSLHNPVPRLHCKLEAGEHPIVFYGLPKNGLSLILEGFSRFYVFRFNVFTVLRFPCFYVFTFYAFRFFTFLQFYVFTVLRFYAFTVFHAFTFLAEGGF